MIYAILYMKLIACLTFVSRGLERPGRMGSYISGNEQFNIRWVICYLTGIHGIYVQQTEKLILYSYFLEPFSMTTCEVISSEKLYIISAGERFLGKYSPPFLNENEVILLVYFKSLNDVSIPQRMPYSFFSSSEGNSSASKIGHYYFI